jgi:pimeloyl-ACP methyl ester carboxylesterase
MSGEVPQLHLRTVPESDPDGQPVVFLHGAWHAGWTWDDWLPRFASAGYHPVAPDLRGHGESAGSWRKARLADYVEDARRVIESLERAPILIGHSLGGLIIQHLLTHGTYPGAGSGHDLPLDAAASFALGLVLAWLGRSEQTSHPQMTTAYRR